MTNTISRFKISFLTILGTGVLMALAVSMIISLPHAKAESPNILVGPDMTLGSTGQGVVVLQGLMSELGYLNIPLTVPFGYYGSLTRAAVARYQADNNISPAAGYFGPLSKISMHSSFASHGWLSVLGW